MAEVELGYRRWLAASRSLLDGRAILADVESVARFHRIQSSPGYDAAARWLCESLRASGLEADVLEVAGDGHQRYLGMLMPEGWACDQAQAWLLDARGDELLCDYAQHPLAVVQRSAPAAGEYPLVAIEDGSEEDHYRGRDVRGRIVLTSGPPHRLHQLAVVERGAAGLLCDGRRLLPPVRMEDTDIDALAYTSFWWAEDEPRGWGFVVSPRRGRELRRRLDEGEALSVRIGIRSRRYAARVPLISTCIPGTSGREILITAHLCHPLPGANDNGSGVACALAAARALQALRHSGEWPHESHAIRILWMPEFTGTHAWAERHRARNRILAALNLDMVGADQERSGATQLLERAPHFMASFAEELALLIRQESLAWVNTYSGPGHFSMMRTAEVPYSGGSDHAVWLDPALASVSAPMLIQWPDRHYHSSSDDVTRCDPASLEHAARVAVVHAATLATADAAVRRAWFDLAARSARRRLYSALDRDDPGRRAQAEMHRGICLLTSACDWPVPDGACGPTPVQLREALESLSAFFDSEIEPHLSQHRTVGAEHADRTPRRLLSAPLDPQRHLLPGWSKLSRVRRESWRRRDLETPGGTTAYDIAWYAADGRRTLATIAELLALEGHTLSAAALESFFDDTASLGLSEWAGDEAPGGPPRT